MSKSNERTNRSSHEPAPAPARAAPGARDAEVGPELEQVLFDLQCLEPGNHELLASVLRNHPRFREPILAQSAELLGNDTVARALALVRGQREVAQFDPSAQLSDYRATIDEPRQDQESDWVVKARAYNQRHPGNVARFNEFTRGSCIAGDELDPAKVAAWQQTHGVPPDGRVGEQTVKAAHLMVPKLG